MQKIFFTLLIQFAFLGAMGQKHLIGDSIGSPVVRHFSSSKINEFRDDRSFQYDHSGGAGATLWDRFVQWFWKTVNQLLTTPGGNRAYKGLLILGSVLVLGFFFFRLAGMQGAGMFKQDAANDGMHHILEGENIHDYDFEEALAQVESAGNFRQGIRLLYLQTLSMLSAKALIQWQVSKTNSDYELELHDTGYSGTFSRLTRDFEYCWYGNRRIGEDDFRFLKESFHQFNAKL